MKKLLKRLQDSINLAIKQDEFNDDASWNYQQGILLDYREAKLILDALNQVNKISYNYVLVDSRCDHDYHTYFNKGYRKCNKCGFEKLM